MKIGKIDKEKEKKIIEQTYTEEYFIKRYNKKPKFFATNIHPDCLVEVNNIIYAVEATGYFYQQETDYSNRLYKKVLKMLNNNNYILNIYNKIGKNNTLNIIDAIYYENFLYLISDIITNQDIIEEIRVNNDTHYNNDLLIYNSIINGELKKQTLETFFNTIDKSKEYYRFQVTLKKKYMVPIKIILIYDEGVKYNKKRTLVPIVSFNENINYNFKSLSSLIDNKEHKLKNIYVNELKKNNIKYDKFILLIHPIDFPLNILPELIYSQLNALFKKTKYDEIIIILREKVMVITKYGYNLY